MKRLSMRLNMNIVLSLAIAVISGVAAARSDQASILMSLFAANVTLVLVSLYSSMLEEYVELRNKFIREELSSVENQMLEYAKKHTEDFKRQADQRAREESAPPELPG